MMNGSNESSLRGRGASQDFPTPAPTVRTRSPSTSTCPDRFSRKEKAVRRLFRYTLLPVDTYPNIIENLSCNDFPDDIETWVQRLPQNSRPRNRSEMSERVKKFRNRSKLRHHFSAPSLPRRPAPVYDQVDDSVARRSIALDENSLQPDIPHINTPATTTSSEKCFSEHPDHLHNDGDLDDHRRPLTPCTQLSSQDTKPWDVLFHGGSNETETEFRRASPRLSTSQSQYLDEAAYYNSEGRFQDEAKDPRKLLSTEEQWLSLRRALAEDEYSNGFVEEVFQLLDELSECSDFDLPFDMTSSDSLYIRDNGRRLIEWRALPFEGSLLPSDYLHIDEHRRDYNICLEGSQAHDDRLCLCAASDDNFNNLWATPNSLSPYATAMLGKQRIALADTERYDHFGNSLLHFLAARGPTDTLFKALEVAADISTLNFGSQTFVHCLSPEWFNGDLSPLHKLFRQLVKRGFDFSQRDSYGQTVLHIWARRLDWERLLPLLSNSAISACIGQQDAFGYRPVSIQRDGDGLHLPVPSLQQPERTLFEITRESTSYKLPPTTIFV
jgi:hypothetical protein